jgi:hypothetical protein
VQAPAPDPLSPQAAWRDAIVAPGLAPPPVTPQSPLLALIDAQADVAHPEFRGGNVTADRQLRVTNLHGTATAAVAAAPANGVGILGVWPGMRALNVAMPDELTCDAAVDGVRRALRAGAAVINMSYGSPDLCYAEYEALQVATGVQVTLVAAAGNELADGNPLEYPASLPHVLTVAAIRPDLSRAAFSNTSGAMDLGAPGVGILTAVPLALDDDGTRDGYEALDGTSFAAPMVSAAAAWVRAARPGLSADQVAQALRLSARDLGPKGWDRATGFGLLDVSAALRQRTPPPDPTEPNDDLRWVDGRGFGKADPPIWRGGRARRLTAVLDRYEDPADVYRVVVPRRSHVTLRVAPVFGDPDLAVYAKGARNLRDRRRRIAVSRHTGRRAERVRLVNGSRRAASIYVAVTLKARPRGLDAAYRLTVGR